MRERKKSRSIGTIIGSSLAIAASLGIGAAHAQAPAQKPNIVVIMGDDIGWSNIGAYNQA